MPGGMNDLQSHPLRSVCTPNLPDILRALNISLLVSTYQAWKVVLVRADGDVIATHYRTVERPMGLAVRQNRLSIGGKQGVWHLQNVSTVGRKLDPTGKRDACYLPQRVQVTGDIDVHEMAWTAEDELWAVNTRFCCLCTLDDDHSFTPRWRPDFVTALAPQDRCHLNGLALVQGRPKYVTALGETDTPGGWRENKRDGGILIDVETNEVLLRGISMPHSPRWHDGKLCLLESGEGSLAVVDLEAGTTSTVTKLPGYTRGLDFVGPLAFIGLSQVRESATFSGVPLVERLDERTCGIWVVNIRTGKTVASLRFEEGVQEIFSVQVLRDITCPEIMAWDDERLSQSRALLDEALAEMGRPPRSHLQVSTNRVVGQGSTVARGAAHAGMAGQNPEGLRLQRQYTSRSRPDTTRPSYPSRISAISASSATPWKSWW